MRGLIILIACTPTQVPAVIMYKAAALIYIGEGSIKEDVKCQSTLPRG
jgi:hypothetical protein